MKARATDYVMYEVNDMARAVAFYRDVLGLELEEAMGDVEEGCDHSSTWNEFKAPPTTIALYSPKTYEQRDANTGPGASVALAVEDANAAVEELKTKGVKVTFGPIESPVCHFASIEDSEGNSIIIHQRKDGSCG